MPDSLYTTYRTLLATQLSVFVNSYGLGYVLFFSLAKPEKTPTQTALITEYPKETRPSLQTFWFIVVKKPAI